MCFFFVTLIGERVRGMRKRIPHLDIHYLEKYLLATCCNKKDWTRCNVGYIYCAIVPRPVIREPEPTISVSPELGVSMLFGSCGSGSRSLSIGMGFPDLWGLAFNYAYFMNYFWPLLLHEDTVENSFFFTVAVRMKKRKERNVSIHFSQLI